MFIFTYYNIMCIYCIYIYTHYIIYNAFNWHRIATKLGSPAPRRANPWCGARDLAFFWPWPKHSWAGAEMGIIWRFNGMF